MLAGKTVVVAGAGGFIGGHLVRRLIREGHKVRAVDVKPFSEWFQLFDDAQNLSLDLSRIEACQTAVREADLVYNLACDMGGMGFIERFKAKCMLSVLINTHLLMASNDAGVDRYFFASSACVYPQYRQNTTELEAGLAENSVYPAQPEDGYGWEKLFSERMCRHFKEDFGLETRVGRFHNVYGPHGSWYGGREKAPAALCRKVLKASCEDGRIEIWGDGRQTRSFTFIEDCIEGILRLMSSEVSTPLNIGSSELVSINALVDLFESFAGTSAERVYLPDAPLGVRGRNSDNTTIRRLLGWEPTTPLSLGMKLLFDWISAEMERKEDVA